ncbi:hypothetical protein AB1Y20_004252 [Prymnesium parvum]|uniref:PKD/REJ-like domain-containing protein n=1 Tax=Prymnesium parvum TaxID=97485 RepID=A0AB34J9F3_PRYPA
MAAGTDKTCGYAEVNVTLTPEPLVAFIQGGQERDFGLDAPVSLSASRSKDADEPKAECVVDVSGAHSCGILRFAWSCHPLSNGAVCAAPPVGKQLDCEWNILPKSFTVGLYHVRVNVSKLGSTEEASSAINLRVGTITDSELSVSITTPTVDTTALFRPNSNSRLQLSTNASISRVSYLWTARSLDGSEVLDLESLNVSSTGNSLPSLVVLPNVLKAGGSYFFRVYATTPSGKTAAANLTLVLSTPPYGGTFSISTDPPYKALSSDITMIAEQWSGNVDDLPLSYAFYFVDSKHALEEELWTALGPASVSNVATWYDPPAGNFTLTCRVFDTSSASTFVQQEISIESTVLDSAKISSLLANLETLSELGDTSAQMQVVNSFANALNFVSASDDSPAQASSSAEQKKQRTALRDELLSLLQSVNLESASPLVLQQVAAALQTVVATPEEVSSEAADKAASLG